MTGEWTGPVRLGTASAHGLSRASLRSRHWRRASWGIYVSSGSRDDIDDRCRALQLALPPGAAFSHLTAALLWGLWLPALPPWLPVMATLPPRTSRPERCGMWVARSRARFANSVVRSGVACTSVPVTIGQLAEDMSLLDLVVAIDGALHGRLCARRDVEDAIRPRQRGAPRLRRALELCDGRSESPWETVLRLLYVSTGFEVDPQFTVLDASGAFVGRADLRLRGTCRLCEYDGASHRDREQHVIDLRREKGFARTGYERYGYTKAEIVPDPRLIVRDAEEAYGLPHDPLRLRDWWPVFEESTLSLTGWNRWLRRLRRFVD